MSLSSMASQVLSDFIEEKIERILVIRSGQMEIVYSAISSLVRTFPAATIDILCQPDMVDEFRAIDRIDKIYLYGGGFFCLKLMEKDLVDELTERKFDLVVVIYSDETGRGYAEVELVSAQIRPRQLFSFNCEKLGFIYKGVGKPH